VELVDEVAPVGQDEDPARPRRLDEPERGDRLARARRVLEPEALVGVRVVGHLARRLGVALRLVGPVLRLLLGLVLLEVGRQRLLARDAGRRQPDVPEPLHLAVARAVGPQGAREERGERARERVDLVGGEDRAVDERRLVLAQQALEPEQERPVAAPADRRAVRAGLELGEGGVERLAAGAAGGERGGDVLTLEHEGLSGEGLDPLDVVGGGGVRGRRGHWREFSHERLDC
jgi:hypothetical protein